MTEVENQVKKTRLTEQQVIEILEEIAVDPRNRSAQIQAIRALREMWDAEEDERGAFADLDDEVSKRRHFRVKGT